MAKSAKQLQRDRDFKLIGQLVDGIISAACLRHYKAGTQEHQFTAKIAAEIERELHHVQVGDLMLSVHLQDIPDKGRGSMEKKIGADLYISIVLDAPDESFSKGMLAQAKWDRTFSPTDTGLQAQSQRMFSRSEASYVWIYQPTGIAVVPAEDVMGGTVQYDNAKTVGGLIADGLRCQEGDRTIGRNTSVAVDASLNEMLEQLVTDRGLDIKVQEVR